MSLAQYRFQYLRDLENGPIPLLVDALHKLAPERRIEQLQYFRFLVKNDVKTLGAAGVRYVLANSIVSSAVLGPRSVAQLEDTVRHVGMGPVYLRETDLAVLPRMLDMAGIAT